MNFRHLSNVPTVKESKASSDVTRIELLSVDLLELQRTTVNEMKDLSKRLSKALGWHYLLDLSWISRNVADLKTGSTLLDAGAGEGLLQWWLAERNMDVISVDRYDRSRLSNRFRRNHVISGLLKGDLGIAPGLSPLDYLPSFRPNRWMVYPGKLTSSVRELRTFMAAGERPDGGTVYLNRADVASLPHIADDSIDAVVSVSSLEHNQPDHLAAVVAELMRILKPGGKLVATLGAASNTDWYHRPSKGWCYTESSLKQLFDLPQECPANYERYDELMGTLKACKELREELDPFYSRSGNNGMPWGKWDPKYQPVGVVKVKDDS